MASNYASDTFVHVECRVPDAIGTTYYRMEVTKGVTSQIASLVGSRMESTTGYYTYSIMLDQDVGCYIYTLYKDSVSNMNPNGLSDSEKIVSGVVHKVELTSYIEQ